MDFIEFNTSWIRKGITMSKLLCPYRCLSSDCMDRGNAHKNLYFSPGEFNSANPPCCPSCKRAGNLYPLTIIHLIAQDRALGVVYGSSQFGNSDRRYMFHCEKGQKYFRAPVQSPLFPRNFSLEPRATTCYNCLCEYGAKFDEKLLTFSLP